MKKIYLSILSIALVTGVNAQVKTSSKQIKAKSDYTIKPTKKTENQLKANVIWQDDFSTEADWSVTNASSPAQDWVWSDDPSAVPAYGPAGMTTASNGYFLINSDAAGATATQDASLTYGSNIDLSSYPNVVLEFEHNYRTFEDARTVSVSTDGGSTWSDFVITTNANDEANQNFDGSTQINISAAAGGSATVMLKFHYQGNFGWHWAVDDVRIIEQPDNDIQLLSSWISGENNEGLEYGMVPVDQMDANYIVGGQISNFGAIDQTNLSLDADFTAFTSNSTQASLTSGDTTSIESVEAITLTSGIYDGTYTVVSTEETATSDNFGNNTYLRSFEVTDNIYALDGIGVYPTAVSELSSYGTSSSSTTDGLIMANYYHIKQNTQLSGYRLLLSGATQPGGEIFISVIDTATFFADQTTALYQASNSHVVTAADTTAGYIDIFFDNVIDLAPNAYFFAIDLYSNSGANDIVLLDDITVAQPSYASMIYVPDDQTVYSNGEAFGIRLLLGDSWGASIDEAALEGVSVYPNPSQGIINVSNDLNVENTITVYNMVGAVVASTSTSTSTTLDLSSNGTGVYMVKVSNENGSMVERIVIK